MALRDDRADILGGPILQRPQSGLFAPHSQHRFLLKWAALFGLGLLVCIACARGLEHLKKHRELRYKKAMRRKHGIPDSDCRPFAVAYAAVKRAHLEREAQQQRKLTNYVSDHSPAVDQRTNAQKGARALRRRFPETTVQLYDYQLPEKHAPVFGSKRPELFSPASTDPYNPNRRRGIVPESLSAERPARRTGRRDLVISLDDNEESRKRSFEDESDAEYEVAKKSRIDGNELIDGDEQADWYAQFSDVPTQPASKESLDRQPEGNHGHVNGPEGSRPVNDLHNADHEPVDEAMAGIDEDDVTELGALARGKKRDRTEAESIFGGDDEGDIGNGRASHHRKRRTVIRRGVEVSARGRKRDREAELPESEGEEGHSETSRKWTPRSSKKRRDKKEARIDNVGQLSTEDSSVSKDPLCDGRKVGDEWEADGIQYKVGDKGVRLRLTLVKRARNKFHMPQDSQHPDRSAALEIYVETWMTEEQYKQAEGRQELAWQEALKESNGSETRDVIDSPTKNGKNLLWDSVKGIPARRPFRQFVPTVPSIRINPFEQLQLQPALGRRVASSSTMVFPVLPGVVDSPTRPGFRGFSKWEKQDREAEAMAKIRAKIEEQKKAQIPPQKQAGISTGVTASELGAKPLVVPTITLTPAPAVTAEEQLGSAGHSKSNTFSFPISPCASDSTKGTAATVSSTTPGFSLPSASISTATPSTLFPAAPTAPNTTSSSTVPPSPFSFSQSPPVLSSTSTNAPSSAMPNFFPKRIGASTPSSSIPLPSTLGTSIQPQPPSTESFSKLMASSFAKPDTLSVSSPAIPPPATKSRIPNFGTPANSASLSVASGTTPAVANTENVVPSDSALTTTPGNSRPAAPLFSFSATSSSFTPLAAPPASSPPSVPKFSFGQASTTPTFAPGPGPAPSTAPQPKVTFKFGQTAPGVTDSAATSTVPAANESRKPPMPVSSFGLTADSNEPAKPSPPGVTSTFGGSTFTSPPAPANIFGKSVAVGGSSSTSTLPKPTTTSNSPFSSAPARTSVPGNASIFSFGGTNSGPKSVEESKLTSSLGALTGSSSPVSIFSGGSSQGQSTFAFGTSTEGSKPTFVFGGSAEPSKPTSMFGGSVAGPQTTFSFGETTEIKSAPGPATQSSKPPNATDVSKPTTDSGSTTLTPSAQTFSFGKDESATSPPNPTNTQTKPATSFIFGATPGATNPIFGQPPAFVTGGDSSQTMFGKPQNPTPSAFGFVPTGGSGSLSTFTFGKSTTQNQKQEQ